MHIQIVTPEKVLLDADADQITIPTTTGDITVLPHHVPLVSQLAPGELIIKKGGKEESIVVVGGFIQVTPSSVHVLADYAVSGKDISIVKAEEAKARAEKAMKERKSDVEFALAESEFRRAILELKVANRHRTH